jgi:hypothetical protein
MVTSDWSTGAEGGKRAVWWEIATVSENETSAIIDLHWKERAGI